MAERLSLFASTSTLSTLPLSRVGRHGASSLRGGGRLYAVWIRSTPIKRGKAMTPRTPRKSGQTPPSTTTTTSTSDDALGSEDDDALPQSREGKTKRRRSSNSNSSDARERKEPRRKKQKKDIVQEQPLPPAATLAIRGLPFSTQTLPAPQSENFQAFVASGASASKVTFHSIVSFNSTIEVEGFKGRDDSKEKK